MTLKEKLNEKLSEAFANEIEQVAEDFAIGFAQWCLSSGIYHQLIRAQKINKELLEIYKETL
jgi:hypothetical protein